MDAQTVSTTDVAEDTANPPQHTATLSRFLLKACHVRGVLIEAAPLIREANRIHGLEGIPATLFGQVLMASMSLLSISKGGVRQVLQLDATRMTAPIVRMQAETRPGMVRGYLNWNQDAQLRQGDDALLSSWMGSPVLTSTVRDLGFSSPYISTIEHASDFIADHIVHYLHQSTQIRADLALSGHRALLIEAMPDCSDDLWMQALTAMAAIDNTMLAEAGRENILKMLESADCQMLGEDSYNYQCMCNADSIMASLQSFSQDQLHELADEHGEITLSCQYCRKNYITKVSGGHQS